MNNIIICEDNDMQRKMITSILQQESKNFNYKIELSTYDPHNVIKHIRSRENSFIYFLDVNLKSDINGFDLAKLIRIFDPNGFIVFLTAHAELTLLTFEYKVQALDYIIKGNTEVIKPRIVECLNVIKNNINYAKKNTNNKLSIDTGGNIILLNYDDILFFETSGKEHKITVHTIHGHYEFYGTLKNLEKTVPSEFYKSHRSYLINTRKIQSIDKSKMLIKMVNNEICYVSLRYMKGLLKKCI